MHQFLPLIIVTTNENSVVVGSVLATDEDQDSLFIAGKEVMQLYLILPSLLMEQV